MQEFFRQQFYGIPENFVSGTIAPIPALPHTLRHWVWSSGEGDLRDKNHLKTDKMHTKNSFCDAG